MPATFTPFGLKAKHSPSGIVRPQRFVVPASDVVTNAANWPANIYQDDAVYLDGNGRLQLATATSNCVGSFMGVEYNDSTGRRTVSNQFNKLVVSNLGANSGLGTSDVWLWLYTDPNLVFEVQLSGANGTAYTPATPAAGVEGALLSWNEGTGQNAVTGFSTGYATLSSSQASGGGNFIVYNLAYDNMPNTTYTAGTPVAIGGNSWSDNYPNVLVRLAQAQFNGNLPGF